MRAQHVKTDGTLTEVELDFSGIDGNRTIQQLVGGYYELVPLDIHGNRRDMLVNEDGLRLELPVNRVATLMLREFAIYHKGQPFPVVGDVLVLHGELP